MKSLDMFVELSSIHLVPDMQIGLRFHHNTKSHGDTHRIGTPASEGGCLSHPGTNIVELFRIQTYAKILNNCRSIYVNFHLNILAVRVALYMFI